MRYRKFGKTGEMVSILGFGCMRLPLIIPGGDQSKINEELAQDLIRFAIDNGVNYIDTAYPYHGTGMGSAGQSEPFVGKVLRDGYRSKVKLATKLPGWLVKSEADMDRLLDQQLQRLETWHIDFYLVHALGKNSWSRLRDMGILKFLDKAISDGRIRYAGFSYHDKEENFREIVDSYNWSFCQIQYNYMDEDYQAGKKGLIYAAGKGLGITIMEPLRGGKLAVNMPEEVANAFRKADDSRTPAEWALGWLWNHPEVSVILSGMNSMEQLKDNLKAADNSTERPFTGIDHEVIKEVRDIFRKRTKIGCTSCSYCMPCPSGVNIPGCFELFNNYHIFGREETYRMLSPSQRASSCTECGNCETQCPQALAIPELLKEVAKVFEV